jgi:hypothetical protein
VTDSEEAANPHSRANVTDVTDKSRHMRPNGDFELATEEQEALFERLAAKYEGAPS